MSKTPLPKIVQSNMPQHSLLSDFAKTANFCDTWTTVIDENQPRVALDYYLEIIQHTPRWIDILMTMRNKMVACFGLKNLGTLSRNRLNTTYQEGDQIGIFKLCNNTASEIILVNHDKHLEVRVSVLISSNGSNATNSSTNRTQIDVSTAVHVFNWFGHLYLRCVVPFHRKIVPSTLKTLHHHT